MLLSVAIPLLVFFLFVFRLSVAISGGWIAFVDGNFQCDVTFGPISIQHTCGYAEFLFGVVRLGYAFLTSGWWLVVAGGAVITYGLLRLFER